MTTDTAMRDYYDVLGVARSASADEIKSFLAGVLEGEGSGSGKVLDDPGWFRAAAIVDLYKRGRSRYIELLFAQPR